MEKNVVLNICYNSVWLMCSYQKHILLLLPSAILRKKIGKPKEEIGNLNGFECMYLSDLKVPYFEQLSSISMKVIPWARHSSPPWQGLLRHR